MVSPFPAQLFADLFAEIGRRSVSPSVVATVMVLQRLSAMSDREAVELLAAVLGQDLERCEDGSLRIARRVAKNQIPSRVDSHPQEVFRRPVGLTAPLRATRS